MAVREVRISEVFVSDPDYNQGSYQYEINPLAESLFQAVLMSKNKYGRWLPLAWGFSESETEAEDLANALRDAVYLRFISFKE